MQTEMTVKDDQTDRRTNTHSSKSSLALTFINGIVALLVPTVYSMPVSFLLSGALLSRSQDVQGR